MRAPTRPSALAPAHDRDRLDRNTQDASAGLGNRDVAGGDLVLVGGKGGQDFGLLAFRDLCEEPWQAISFSRALRSHFLWYRDDGLVAYAFVLGDNLSADEKNQSSNL